MSADERRVMLILYTRREGGRKRTRGGEVLLDGLVFLSICHARKMEGRELPGRSERCWVFVYLSKQRFSACQRAPAG